MLTFSANGPDPQLNPRLAAVIAAAKKQGFPKQSIENAIARGQGVSSSGAPLDSVTIEAMLPFSVAAIIECKTDSRLRTLADIKYLIKEAGGSVTATNHLFERKGKIVFERSDEAMEEEKVFDIAVEAGASEVDVDEIGTIKIETEPARTTAVAETLAGSFSMEAETCEIVWVPKEEMMVQAGDPDGLSRFLGMPYTAAKHTGTKLWDRSYP